MQSNQALARSLYLAQHADFARSPTAASHKRGIARRRVLTEALGVSTNLTRCAALCV